ncbi:DUF4097 domain-containing protein [Streptomyces sp. NPDC057702]|uniref:DUF4097 family beta strand repeat-containing protein n=1 Tax=unclassified Streptomyces TaxID=2593676 RepID=UPI0036BCFD5B
MPEFDTPEPISVTLEGDFGTARVIAGERAVTVVEVLPDNGAEDDDVRAAQQTKVTYANGALLVKGPRKRSLFGRTGSLDVTVEVPAGSHVHGGMAVGDVICEGRFGRCDLKVSVGDIRVGEAERASLRTGLGDISVDRVAGDAELTGSGRVTAGSLGGAATVRNLNGETTLGEVAGDLRVNSSNGRISVGVAHGGVDARSAHSGIRVGEVVRGAITLQTGTGDLEIGVRESVAVWLDAHSGLGAVRNTLGPIDAPAASDQTVQVRARTRLGDILLHRA